ncbi:DUF882 domain-containing protein [Polyangium sp. 6x1]|uniref:YcbK family protein n=1 Tax=Polyangium sp. 6x1 TaxID=3042689 RepID=UPI0024830F05|nr:DUF882 domain-containing protein [Polyangium sp. 6x1]MDI1445128.1 DUF882 domain-containing protein [Polyangium sp. 6x1]
MLTLAAPFAFGEAFAEEAAAPKAAEPAKAEAPAKTEKAPEEPKKTAAAPKKRKSRRKAPPKRMVQAEPKTAEAPNKAASTKAKPEPATKPATHDKGATTTASTKTAAAKKSDGATTTASTKTAAAKKSDGATTTASVKSTAPAGSTKTASVKKTEGAAGVSRSKKASTRTPSKKRKGTKKAEAETDRPPCFAPAISIDRNGLEGETFSLVDCKGKVLDEAREKLSVLARPWGTPRPELPKAKKPEPRTAKQEKPGSAKGKEGKEKAATPALASQEIAPNVRLLDPGLLSRVEAIAKHFPGKGISLVSGYRPKSRGSLHQSARALDLRVTGVSNEEVVAFCKTIADTGCGYYPNSSFVHVDVRTPGTGSVTWIDASGPGETPRYVSEWPPPPEPADAQATSPVAAVDEAMEQQGKDAPASKEQPAAKEQPAPKEQSAAKEQPAAQAQPPTNPTAQPPAEKDEDPKEADPRDPVPPPKKTQPTPPPAAKSPTAR